MKVFSFLNIRIFFISDLKPENIFLVDSHTYNIKVGDFGLAKIADKYQHDFNVQTCWYRSPEVVLHNQYSYEADLWSVGNNYFRINA